jgi:hypothetical protein
MWGIGLRWLRDRKVVEDYRILHGSEKTAEYRLSPIRATIERGTPLQPRLDRPVLGSRAQGVFGRASPAHDRPAKGSHATLLERDGFEPVARRVGSYCGRRIAWGSNGPPKKFAAYRRFESISLQRRV